MLIKDEVYGEFDITEQVLIDLIHSPPLQRLKKISQYGNVPGKYDSTDFSRYSHCVGVMLILRKFGANVKEQIAGLLHDVPHTAFSHVVDWVFSKANVHEDIYEEVLLKSEIKDILEDNDYDPYEFLEHSDFTLLERDMPDLCADRLDYTFRHFVKNKENVDLINEILKKLNARDVDGKKLFVFEDPFVAKKFTEMFLDLYRDFLYSPANYVRYHFLSKTIKEALDKGLLDKKDLMKDDEFVFNKLKASKDEDILHYLSHVSSAVEILHVNRGEEDLFATYQFKYVDPYVHFENKFRRITEIFPELEHRIEQEKSLLEEGYLLKIERK